MLMPISIIFFFTGRVQLALPFIVCLFIMPLNSSADDFDGSKQLAGLVEKVLEINQFKINSDADPDIIGLPKKFVIDFDEKTLKPSKDSMVRRISKIRHVGHIENKLILQGVEVGVENIDDGLAWSIVISKKTGKVVLSASGNGVAYVVFGTCTVVQN